MSNTTAMKWLTIRNHTVEKEHASYDAAKFWAQCTHDTQQSPKREAAGFYTLGRTHIVRADVWANFSEQNS
jgi:hypothetical protein